MFNEKEIISKVLQGDVKAFESLVVQYQKLVFLVIHRLIGRREDAEDVCQEVFAKVYRRLDTFAFQSRLSTWIARIAYLTSINHLKKHAKDRYSTELGVSDDFRFEADDPETQVIKKDNAAYIHQLIDQMPLNYKTVITLYHLKEFSYQEIEHITGMPEGTVKSYLFRARKMLKEKLKVYLNRE